MWIPFILQSHSWFGLDFSSFSFLTIYQHFDGLLYLVPAKTLYNPQAIEQLGLELTLSNGYYAAHLPLYPLLIRFCAPIFGYLKSMVLVNLLATSGLVIFFYYFISKFNLTKKPFLLSCVLIFFPRFLVVRAIGAPESLFMLFILVSLLFFEKQKYLFAGIAGALSVMTKTPGILLGVAYVLVFIEQMIHGKQFSWKWLGITLIGFGLLAVFGLYAWQYGDFFAYFHSGDNIHLSAPFSVFNFTKPWVGTAWLDDVLFYYFLYGLTTYTLYKSKYRSLFYFSLVYFIVTLFIQHRDIARYSLPIWPLAAIAFESFFTSKKFLIIFIIIFPGIMLYAWNFLQYNILPISDWRPFI